MKRPCGQVTVEMLDRAKSNLLKRFAVIGITERFDESLILLQHVLSWRTYRVPERNVGANRPLRTDVGEEALEAIMLCNKFDLDLYRFAFDHFEQAVSKIDMPRELARLGTPPRTRLPNANALRLPRDLVDGLSGGEPFGNIMGTNECPAPIRAT